MRKRVSVLALVAIGVCGAAAVKWWLGGSSFRGVTARLERDGQIAVLPPVVPTKVKLGSSTRSAIAANPDAGFEVRVDANATLLNFNMGVRETRADRQLAFSIHANVAGEEQLLFREHISTPFEGWIQRRVGLEHIAGARRLRFRIAGADAADTAAYWGGVRVLGRRRGALPANLILISLDTLGADHLSSFFGPAGTSPKLDTILERSFSFRRAYAQYPNTPVSHASVFSGLYPRHHGVYETTPSFAVDPTLAGVLAGRGYTTVAFTEDAFVSSDFGFDRGFDRYDNGVDEPLHADDEMLGTAAETFAKARAWLEEFGETSPFCLFIHTYEVHAPYKPKDAEALSFALSLDPQYRGPFRTAYSGGLLELAHNSGESLLATRDLIHLAALYAGEINHLDRVLDRFFNLVAALPVAERTLMVVFADHGEEFGEHGKLGHGETLHSTALHVPLAFYWPGRIKAGQSDAIVQLVDVMPTVLELLGVPVPAHLDGRSLAPLVTRRVRRLSPQPAFAELQTTFGDCRRLQLGMQCRVDRLAVQTARFRFTTSKVPEQEELFDVQSDPQELHNLAAELPEALAEHQRLLAAYASDAPVTAPATGRTVDPSTHERLRALGYEQ